MLSSAAVASGSITGVVGLLVGGATGWLRLVLIAASGLGVLIGPRHRRANAIAGAIAVVAEGGSGHAAASGVWPVAVTSSRPTSVGPGCGSLHLSPLWPRVVA